MNERFGTSKSLTLLTATLFCVTFAANHAQAQNGWDVGDGVLNGPNDIGLCWHGVAGSGDGNCGLLPGDHLNLILGDSLSLYLSPNGNPAGMVMTSPLLLVFGVPIQDLLDFGNYTNANPDLTASNILGGKVFHPSGPNDPNFPFDPPLGGPYDITPGSGIVFGLHPTWTSGFDNGDDYGVGGQQKMGDLLGLAWSPAGANNANDWKGYMYSVPATLADSGALFDLGVLDNPDTPELDGLPITPEQFKAALIGGPSCGQPGFPPCVEGFHVFVYELWLDSFGTGDVLHIDTQGIPLGTMVTAWGQGCVTTTSKKGETTTKCDYFSTPPTRSAIMMPFEPFRCDPSSPGCTPEVPEPTTLLLLGTGLLSIGRQLRKRQRKNPTDTL